MIKVNDISKEYEKGGKKNTVLKNVSFQIGDGEVVALLGANGSGKSTLIKCICGVIYPTTGNVEIEGRNSFRERKKLLTSMGILFNQKPSFIVDLSVSDNLQYFKAIYDIPNDCFEANLAYLDSYLNFKDLMDRSYRKLSFGERVKCEIVSILMHSPKYILLDEPTIGLDYSAKKGLYDLLAELKDQGATILITTHEIDYIEQICDKAVILKKGEKVYEGNPHNVIEECDLSGKLVIEYEEIINDRIANELFENSKPDTENNMMTVLYQTEDEKMNYMKRAMEAFNIRNITSENANIREVLENVLNEIQ